MQVNVLNFAIFYKFLQTFPQLPYLVYLLLYIFLFVPKMVEIVKIILTGSYWPE